MSICGPVLRGLRDDAVAFSPRLSCPERAIKLPFQERAKSVTLISRAYMLSITDRLESSRQGSSLYWSSIEHEQRGPLLETLRGIPHAASITSIKKVLE